jgi:hypothetical protein
MKNVRPAIMHVTALETIFAGAVGSQMIKFFENSLPRGSAKERFEGMNFLYHTLLTPKPEDFVLR